MFEKLKKNLRNTCLYYKYMSLRRVKEKKQFSSKTDEQIMQDVQTMFHERIGRELDWKNLKTYTEKMQWEKLFDKNPSKVQLSDKFLVREWIKAKIGEEYLIPIIGHWDDVKDIDFTLLPNSFVLKTNCGTGDVIIVRDKKLLSKHDIRVIREKLKYYMHCDFGISSYELHYSKIKPCVIAEELIISDEDDLPDYKFLCFDGKPCFCWVDKGRYTDHSRHVYDMDWNFQNWNQFYDVIDIGIPRPVGFEKMVEIAKVLSSGFSHVRVDLYNVNGRILFGEMTFTNGSGFDVIRPYEADKMLGELWKIKTSL